MFVRVLQQQVSSGSRGRGSWSPLSLAACSSWMRRGVGVIGRERVIYGVGGNDDPASEERSVGAIWRASEKIPPPPLTCVTST